MMNNGAPTRAQVEAIGMTWPLKSGWLERLVGKQIEESEFHRISDARKIRAAELRRLKKAQKKAKGTPTLPAVKPKASLPPNDAATPENDVAAAQACWEEYHRKVGLEAPLMSHMFRHAFLSGVKHSRK
jgi:hypothetical protein